jgi:hypothetical protein
MDLVLLHQFICVILWRMHNIFQNADFVDFASQNQQNQRSEKYYGVVQKIFRRLLRRKKVLNGHRFTSFCFAK